MPELLPFSFFGQGKIDHGLEPPGKGLIQVGFQVTGQDHNIGAVLQALEKIRCALVGIAVMGIIDLGPFTATDAKDAGLIDGIAYLDELRKVEVLREFYPEFEYKSIPEITIAAYHADKILSNSWEKKPVIAVIVAQGEVQSDGATSMFSAKSNLTPALMKKSMKQALKNPQTKAILLRINSPGGAALAGEEIYHLFDKQVRIPLTVSMGNVAASGGYYFAMAGRKLFANRSTITGSIGIFGGKVDLSGLHSKLALQKEMYLRGKYAGMLSTMKPFTVDEREKYFYHLKSMYTHFIELVAENRSLPVDSINNLGQGRVWVGSEAKQNGLIDSIGGYKEALDFIAEQENLPNYNIEIYPLKRPLLILPGGSLFSAMVGLLKSNRAVELIQEELQVLDPEQFYTRMPFDISIE